MQNSSGYQKTMPQSSGHKQNTEVGYPPLLEANYTMFILFICYVCSFIDRQIINLLIGPIRETFSITDFQFSLIQGVGFAVCYALAGFPLGRLADSSNRRTLIFFAVLVWSLMTCMAGLASTVMILFIARLGVAIGEAGLSPAAFSMLSDSYNKERLGFAISFYKMAIPVGMGLAMVLSGVLYDYYASLEVLSLPLYGELLPWQMTLFTVGLLGVFLALLVLTIKEPKRIEEQSISKNKDFTMPTLGECFNFFVENKLLYLGIIGAAAMLATANYGISSWYAEFLQREYALTPGEAGSSFGSVYLTCGTAGILMGPVFAKYFQKKGYIDAYLRTIKYCVSLAILPAIFATLSSNATTSIILIGIALFLLNSYLGILTAAVQVVTPNRMRGQVSALYLFSTTIIGLALGSSLVAVMTDFIYANEADLNLSIATINAIFLPLALLFIVIGTRPYRERLQKISDGN